VRFRHDVLCWYWPLGLTWHSTRRCRVLYVLVASSQRGGLRLPLRPRLGDRCSSYASNSLGSSFYALSPPFLLGSLSLFLHLSSLSPSVHDLCRCAYVRAIGLSNRNGAASCAGPAVGCAATRQVGHRRVLLDQIRRERVRKSDSFLKHKANCRRSAPTYSKGGVRLGVRARARARCFEMNALLLARID
jgi:hypothetical protein